MAGKAVANLRAHNDTADLRSWHGLVTAFYLGQIREKALRAALAKRYPLAERQLYLPQVNFYIAGHRLIEGRRAEAKQLFEKVRASAEKGSFEYIAAGSASQNLVAR